MHLQHSFSLFQNSHANASSKQDGWSLVLYLFHTIHLGKFMRHKYLMRLDYFYQIKMQIKIKKYPETVFSSQIKHHTIVCLCCLQ